MSVIAENETSLAENWVTLSNSQRSYILLRLSGVPKSRCAESIGISRSRIYEWPERVENTIRIIQSVQDKDASSIIQQAEKINALRVLNSTLQNGIEL